MIPCHQPLTLCIVTHNLEEVGLLIHIALVMTWDLAALVMPTQLACGLWMSARDLWEEWHLTWRRTRRWREVGDPWSMNRFIIHLCWTWCWTGEPWICGAKLSRLRRQGTWISANVAFHFWSAFAPFLHQFLELLEFLSSPLSTFLSCHGLKIVAQRFSHRIHEMSMPFQGALSYQSLQCKSNRQLLLWIRVWPSPWTIKKLTHSRGQARKVDRVSVSIIAKHCWLVCMLAGHFSHSSHRSCFSLSFWIPIWPHDLGSAGTEDFVSRQSYEQQTNIKRSTTGQQMCHFRNTILVSWPAFLLFFDTSLWLAQVETFRPSFYG